MIAVLSAAFIPIKKIRIPETKTDTVQVAKNWRTLFETSFPQSKVAKAEAAAIKTGAKTDSRKNSRTDRPKYFFESKMRIPNAKQFIAILM